MRHVPARSVALVRDPTGAPAVNLTKMREAGHVDLVKRAEKAGISLSKHGLSGMRAQVVLVLDHSGSMRSDYRSGKVQTLVERVLGFALQIDIDGVVPVLTFDTTLFPTVHVGASATTGVEDYRDVVNRRIWKSKMGRTDLAAALAEVRVMAQQTDAPMFVVVVTDGSPNNRRACGGRTVQTSDLARYPVFLKFLAIREVPYLADLDDLSNDKRLLDNVDAKAFEDPAAATDLEFAEAMVDEWDTWVTAALAAGVLR